MMNQSNPPAPSHDAIKLLSDLLALVANPVAAKQVVNDLLAASAKHQELIDQAHAAMVKVADLRSEVAAGVAELRTQTAERLSADQAAFDKRVAEQTNALAAREKRTAEALAKAQADSEAAAKMKATLAEKMRVLAS